MKKNITLQEAYDLIENAIAVRIDNDGLCYPSLWELDGNPENEWLYLSWGDSDYNEFAIKFIEEDQEIYFDGSTIYMKDGDGDDCELTLLVPMVKF